MDANTHLSMIHLKERLQRGELTTEQANVEKVLIQRFVLGTARIPGDVRKALNAAVKRGELGHLKREGHKPEAYFHPTFAYLAKAARNQHERDVLRASAAVMATNIPLIVLED